MRKKIAAAVAAGAIVISGVVLAGPALGETVIPAPAAAGSSAPADPGADRVDRLKQALTGLVTDGTLTQDQADKVAATLAAAGPGLGGHHGPGRGGPDLAAAATALGMTEAELRAAVEGGTTLAKIAETKGVPLDTLVTALVDAEKARIAQEVSDGRITQAQADERLADVMARVTDRVNDTPPAGPRGEHPTPPAGGPGN